MQEPLEIEHKYLIRMPDTATLAAMPGARVFSITQTYLTAQEGLTRRVRARREGERTAYIFTEKERLSPLTAIERERDLSEAEYREALHSADPAATPIEKTRYAIPHASHTLEIDIYPFWEDYAILEIELASEDETVSLPPFLSVVCEVTADRRFKNVALAKNPQTRADLPRLLLQEMT